MRKKETVWIAECDDLWGDGKSLRVIAHTQAEAESRFLQCYGRILGGFDQQWLTHEALGRRPPGADSTFEALIGYWGAGCEEVEIGTAYYESSECKTTWTLSQIRES